MLKTIGNEQVEQLDYTTVGVTNSGFSVMNFDTNIGSFNVHRNDNLTCDGNPRYTIIPLGFIENEVPKIVGTRRIQGKQAYTIQSYNIMGEMQWFITKMKQAISSGQNLYVNN